MAYKKVFVTVGTTRFDKLVRVLTTPKVLNELRKKGYRNLTIQIGQGSKPQPGISEGVHIEYYHFKDSLAEDISRADLIISHAGAGSCLEALEAGKPLLVVINEDLMDNHQTELATQFGREGYLYYCNCNNLEQTVKEANFENLVPYVKGDPKKFAQYLDTL